MEEMRRGEEKRGGEEERRRNKRGKEPWEEEETFGVLSTKTNRKIYHLAYQEPAVQRFSYLLLSISLLRGVVEDQGVF